MFREGRGGGESPFPNQIVNYLLMIPVIYYLQVEAGDVIVSVNGTDVHHFTTKEGIL